MRVEIGSGGNPDLSYDFHIDIRENLPHVEKVCDGSDLYFFKGDTITEIRANDVIEHFSYRQVRDVLKEWLRVLVSGGIIHLVTPNFKVMAQRYLSEGPEGHLEPNDALSWSFWILGGQDYGDEWRYNAHYTLFDEESWHRLANEVGFDIIRLDSDGGTNLIIDIEKRA